MTRIIIELEPSSAQPSVSVASAPGQVEGFAPPEHVLAQAAALGAINGGPAPASAKGAEASAAPIASSLPASTAMSHEIASGGVAPRSVFGLPLSTQ
jgi:hypothetical protein